MNRLSMDHILFMFLICIFLYVLQYPIQIDREYWIQKALFAAGFPVPEPLLYCSDVSVIGTQFYMMQHVQVSVLLAATLT